MQCQIPQKIFSSIKWNGQNILVLIWLLTVILGAFNMKSKLTDFIWLHDYVIAPVSVELTFRACIVPVLLQCFPPVPTIFISAGLFGVGNGL